MSTLSRLTLHISMVPSIFSSFVGLAIVQGVIPFTVAKNVIFDLDKDTDEQWFGLNCMYTRDYSDFWAFGYPVTLPEEDDKYPEFKGFWTPGVATQCQMHYHGGPQTPPVQSITVGMYVKGKPQIWVSSKQDVLEEESQEIGLVPTGNDPGWIKETIDLTTAYRPLVLNFTLISLGDEDLLLLDTIEFDFGRDTTPPTEPPPPIDKNSNVVLDTKKDLWVGWEDDCTYIEDYGYYWAFGCPAEAKVESLTTIGYWSPCSATKSCKLRFHGNSTVLATPPASIKIRLYLDGGASVNTTIQSNRDSGYCTQGCALLGVIISDPDVPTDWLEHTITQNVIAEEYTINIELVPQEGGTVLVDKVQLLQGTGTGTTGATEGPPGDGSNSAGVSVYLTPGYFFCILFISVSPSLFLH